MELKKGQQWFTCAGVKPIRYTILSSLSISDRSNCCWLRGNATLKACSNNLRASQPNTGLEHNVES